MIAPLRPTAQLSADALLPGDPGRALALAQALLERPRMANHHRGLWGYVGTTADGRELTIQATGIGGPSGAAVLDELARCGVRRAIRLGTCTSLGSARLGELLAVEATIAAEGASRELGGAEALPDGDLHQRLLAASAGELAAARVASVDLPGTRVDGRETGWAAHGVAAVESSSATLFALGRQRGVSVAAALVVASAGDATLEDDAVEAASLRLGRVACEALGAAG